MTIARLKGMTMQLDLFTAAPVAPPVAPAKVTGKTAKREHEKLAAQLAAAREDLAQAEYNIAEIEMHERASANGIIDENWWQGAIQFGIAHWEIGAEYQTGSYPLKLRRWMRHLRFTEHAARYAALCAVRELELKVSTMAALLGIQSAGEKLSGCQ